MDLIRSTLKIFFSKILNSIVVFAGIAFFARELGAAQMGIFFLYQALLGVLVIPADLGIRGAAEKRLSENQPSSGLFTTALLLKSIPLAVVIGGIFLFQGVINSYLVGGAAGLLALGLVLGEFAQLMVQTLNAELRVGETAAPRLSRNIVWVTAGVVFVQSGFAAHGLIYSLLIGDTVMLLWALLKSSTEVAAPSTEHMRSLIEYAKFDVIAGAGWRFFNWLDVLIIGYFLTNDLVGAYEIAWKTAGVTILVSKSIRVMMFPQISAWDSEGETDRIESLVEQLITPALLLVIPSFFGILLFSREILELVYGAEYAVAWVALIILLGHRILHAVDQIIARSLQAIDRPDIVAYTTLGGVGVNIILNIVLVWQFGIAGAATATFVSYAVAMALRSHYLSRFFTIGFPYTEIGWCIGASIVMSLVLIGIQELVLIDSLPKLLLIISLGAVIYIVFILSSPALRLRIFRSIRNVLS